jgi:multiple sugar transport system substrate-binding protein
VSALSERQKFFATPTGTLIAYDFPEATHAFYPELEAAYHRKLLTGMAKPPANWKAFITETANEMRELAAKLQAKK